MIDRDHVVLSVTEQCRLLSIPRLTFYHVPRGSTFYHIPRGETVGHLALTRRIDKQFLQTPFCGVRQMTWHLRTEGERVNSKRLRRLMQVMNLMPVYQRPKTSMPATGHRMRPCVLRGRTITEANEVWRADITYILIPTSPHLHPRGARLPAPRLDHGTGDPQGVGVPTVEHDGDRTEGPRAAATSASRRRTRRSPAMARPRS